MRVESQEPTKYLGAKPQDEHPIDLGHSIHARFHIMWIIKNTPHD